MCVFINFLRSLTFEKENLKPYPYPYDRSLPASSQACMQISQSDLNGMTYFYINQIKKQ